MGDESFSDEAIDFLRRLDEGILSKVIYSFMMVQNEAFNSYYLIEINAPCTENGRRIKYGTTT